MFLLLLRCMKLGLIRCSGIALCAAEAPARAATSYLPSAQSARVYQLCLQKFILYCKFMTSAMH
eukprot:6457944-Amphidinium_carterae.1